MPKRHLERPTPTVVVAADGRSVNTGVPPRTGKEFRQLLAWLDELGIREAFRYRVFLEMGTEREFVDLSKLGVDSIVTEIYGAVREAMIFIASHLDAYEFFAQGQRHGLTCGVVNAPEEVLDDPHFASRGFPVTIDDEILGRSYVSPGAPFLSNRTGYVVTRAPGIGEHNALLGDAPAHSPKPEPARRGGPRASGTPTKGHSRARRLPPKDAQD